MSKKYKSLLKYLVLSMIFITIITALISRVYSSYNPTREEFRAAETSSLLGKKLEFNGKLWRELDEIGQLSCFYHKEGAYNLMAEIYIHSVFDIGFDEQEGRMKLYSMINDGNKTSKTTFANGNNTSVGNLAAQSARSNNAYGVYKALRKAIDEGTVVHEATIGEQEWWPDGVQNVETDENLIKLYDNYKRLSKEKTTYNLIENTDVVAINDKAYTIVGPLKISYGGKDITKVTAGNATWTKDSKDSIYWSTDKKEWSNDFNKGTSAKYELNNKEFYIAVETSKLPDSGKYKITMEQDEFKYYKSRTIVCTSVYAQQTGMYCYDNNPTPVNGKVEWELDRIPTEKSLIIAKKDKKSGEKITGAGFKLYAILKDGTKGWVSGSADSDKKYESSVTNATEYADDVEINSLKLGEYYLFETKAPEGYELEDQENYNKAKDGIPTPTGKWVYVGNKTLNSKSSKTVTYEVKNSKTILGKTRILKIDKDTKKEITDGEFKIYAVLYDGTCGWLAGNITDDKTYETDASKATTYKSNVDIEKLKAGTYYYFETKAPEGYEMKKQEGYNKTDKNIANVRPSNSEYVYLGSKVIPKDVEESQVYDFTATNRKSVDKIEGYVWQDRPDTKANKTDSIYNDKSNDILLEGLEVALYDNNGKAIATTTTDKNGYYSFTEKDAGEDKNLYYEELTKGYVEFKYDNYKYICVDVLAGENAKVNSKAKERTITTDKLDDNNISEDQGKGTYQGKAETDPKVTPLTAYYNNETYTISNINLGLMEKLEPEFTITEDIAYMKVKFGDYVYKYEYMKDSDQLTRTTVPTVNQQVSKRTFTAKIYPSDVAYESKAQDGTLKVYMVYRINVFNNTSNNIDNNYKEAKMYVESLMNTYNSSEYVLNNKETHDVDIEEASKDFGLWSEEDGDENGYAIASYNCSDTWRNYKAGVKTEFDKDGNIIKGKEGYVTSYIQFQLTESFVNKILEKALTEGDLETAPSVATAKTFHEYWRKDQVWDESKDRYYEGNILEDAEMSKSYYLHKSKYQTEKSADLAMKFALPEKQRKLSGVVFEDKVVTTDTKLGNGKKDNGENTVSGVKVELLDKNMQLAKVYPFTIENGKYTKYNEEQDAKATTNNKGEFTIEGVIPGEYYLRFTYGDGSQKICDKNGNVIIENNKEKTISLNDYKSTIIDVANDDDAKIIQDAIKNGTNLEWYKELTQRLYSTAIDSLVSRSKTDGYVYYADGTIHYEDGSLVEEKDILKVIDSYTPRIAITIEDSKDKAYQAIKDYGIKQDDEGNIVDEIIKQEDSPYYEFEGFNFGIITEPNSTITTSKTISNIKLTDQTGATLVSADPKDKNAKYVTALDEVGSNIKAEIEENLLYGSEVEVTYNITLTNDSDIDYIENDEEHLGDWYNYGIKTEGVTEPKSITIKEVGDILNEKYNSDTVKLVSYSVNEQPVDIGEIKIVKEEGENSPQIEEKTTIEEDGTETTKTKMTITGWSDQMERKDTQTIEYTVSALLSSDNEDEEGYTNSAQVTKIKLDKLTPLTSGSEWSKVDETVVSITPPTGQDKTSTYYIAGAIALIVLASGIVVLKKKVL